MRYKGKQLRGPKVETLAIPREDGDIIFQAQAVMDYGPFLAIDPEPEIPDKIVVGGKRIKDPENSIYKAGYTKWLERKQLWMILESLKVTKDMEWETVDLGDPATYNNYWDELGEAGFNEIERLLIRNLALKTNSIDSEKMEEARERFLHEQQAALSSTSPTVEVKNTLSGGPASASESSLQA